MLTLSTLFNVAENDYSHTATALGLCYMHYNKINHPNILSCQPTKERQTRVVVVVVSHVFKCFMLPPFKAFGTGGILFSGVFVRE